MRKAAFPQSRGFGQDYAQSKLQDTMGSSQSPDLRVIRASGFRGADQSRAFLGFDKVLGFGLKVSS